MFSNDPESKENPFQLLITIVLSAATLIGGFQAIQSSNLGLSLIILVVGLVAVSVLISRKILSLQSGGFIVAIAAIVVVFTLLIQPASVVGAVIRDDGSPAQGLALVLTNSRGVEQNTVTDENGEFEFQDVPEGRYAIVVRDSDTFLISGEMSSGLQRILSPSVNVGSLPGPGGPGATVSPTPVLTETSDPLSPMPTDTSVPLSPVPTDTPRPTWTPIPSATPFVSESLDPAVEWSTNISAGGDCISYEENGYIAFSNMPLEENFSVCELISDEFRPDEIGETAFIEARINLLADASGDYSVGVAQFYTSDLEGSNGFLAQCGINTTPNDNSVGLFFNVDRDWTIEAETDIYETLPGDIENWYRMRIEVDPMTLEFRCFVNGTLLGSHIPDYAEELRVSLLKRNIGVFWSSNSQATFYFDDVRVTE